MTRQDVIKMFNISYNGLKILENELQLFENDDLSWKTYNDIMINKIKNLIILKYSLPIDAKNIDNTNAYITKNGIIYKEKGNTGLYFKAKLGLHSGYLHCELSYNKERYKKRVHRLVAEMFIDNPSNKPYVNHIDGNKMNNNVNNLEWVTNSENVKHAYKNNLIKNYKGYDNKLSKPVNMYNLQEELKNSFGSISEASRITNIPKRTISNQCDRKTKSRKYEYYFRYQNN